MRYADCIKKILSPEERVIFQKLKTPEAIQSFLDPFPINFELGGETNFSPRRVLRDMTMHCFEGAVFAAAAFAYHGQKPLVMDFATAYDDEDHTVALFRRKGHWGAISKTNHAVLRYRDAIYKTPRELAASYFHEYYMWDGRKSLRAFSRPFDLSQYSPDRWVTSEKSLDWLMNTISAIRYYALVPKGINLRRASPIEIKALKLVEWQKDKKHRQSH